MNLVRHSGVSTQLRESPKLICLARTFPKHAAELGNAVPTDPLFFLKSGSSVVGDGDFIKLPHGVGVVHHEGEIAVVLAGSLSHASKMDVADAITGYTVLNDVTARSVQSTESGRFSRAKSYDTFCPMSDELVTGVSWRRLSVRCLVNGELRQRGSLCDMYMEPFELIAWVSRHLTLNAGDVVSLGTPPGVNCLLAGDELQTMLCVDEQPTICISNRVVCATKT